MPATAVRMRVRDARDGAARPVTPQAPRLFPARTGLWGPVTRARLVRSVSVYLGIFALAVATIAMSARPAVDALALGLILPGGGVLLWAGPGAPMPVLAIALFAGSLLVFAMAIAIWFATGNVLLPIAAWLGLAVAAAAWDGPPEGAWQGAAFLVPSSALSGLVLAWLGSCLAARHGVRRRARLNAFLGSSQPVQISMPDPSDCGDGELSREDLRLLRLVLDRALQPVGAFEGFEPKDQFQTASLRYQLNFMSYALSIAQAVHLPACRAYLQTAQENLAAKVRHHRVWRYWKLENMWGNLRTGADPVGRDNIMFSGFLAAQLAYYRSASGTRRFDEPGSLSFEHPSGERYAYSLPALIEILARGYRQAEFGLLACEPNWVYPLCNAITVSALRAHDAATGTSHWEGIARRFRHALETEFITPGGRLIACRSSHTGIAVPPIGGVVMQALPSLFLNVVTPDIAHRQWLALRHDLNGRDWRRAMWPVDVGNYRMSRASSYAATAAAAVELGDTEAARLLLQHLDDECPLTISKDVAHRANASLWAQAVELMARCGRTGAIRSLATRPAPPTPTGPYIEQAGYPDILFARAVSTDGLLSAVLYPGTRPGLKAVRIGGLEPNQSYRAATGTEQRFRADPSGRARLSLLLDGRTELRIARVA